MKSTFVWLCVLGFSFVFAVYMAKDAHLENQNMTIEIGARYLHSFYWNTEDPFEEIAIDTVKLISIRGDYAQWQYSNGMKLSAKTKFFKNRIRNCNCN